MRDEIGSGGKQAELPPVKHRVMSLLPFDCSHIVKIQ